LSIEAHRKHALPAHSLVPCSLLFTLCNVNEYPDRNVTGFPRANIKTNWRVVSQLDLYRADKSW